MAKPKEKWIKENLCSLDEKVRIERGPQVMQMTCNDANLSNAVTAPDYVVGRVDKMGNLIRPDCMEKALAAKAEAGDDDAAMALGRFRAARQRNKALGRGEIKEGGKMTVVDWKGKHKPFVWKIYRAMVSPELDTAGNPVDRIRFELVEEVEGKDAALARAHEIFAEAA